MCYTVKGFCHIETFSYGSDQSILIDRSKIAGLVDLPGQKTILIR